jgi:hypothetical protein
MTLKYILQFFKIVDVPLQMGILLGSYKDRSYNVPVHYFLILGDFTE